VKGPENNFVGEQKVASPLDTRTTDCSLKQHKNLLTKRKKSPQKRKEEYPKS